MNTNPTKQAGNNPLLLPALFGFFIMGFADVVGIATSYVKSDFGLSDTWANMLPMLVFLWFALFSIPSGVLMGKIGKKATVLLSFAITILGMLLPMFFYSYASVLIAFALLGIGNTILQVSLNPLVAAIVPAGRVTSTLTFGQFIKAISSFLGPLIAGAAMVYLGNWKVIFIIYSFISLGSFLWLWFTGAPVAGQEVTTTTFASTLARCKDPYIASLFVGILCIVGIDVGLNTTIPKLLMEKTGITLVEAGWGTSLYFAGRTIGSFAGAFILVKFAPQRFLQYSMIAGILTFAAMLMGSRLLLMFGWIVCTGLACSNVFSILFSLALQHDMKHTNEISALMIMGVSGGALVTPLMGLVADSFGQVAGMSVLFLCMLYILFLSFITKNR